MHKLQWSLNLQIAGGPRLVAARSIDVDAYDSFNLNVESAGADVEVELQPGGAGQVKVLIITSDHYGSEVTYKVNSSANDPVVLNQPLILTGEGAVGLLDPTPQSLFFGNGLPEPVAVQILIGRDATP